MKINRLIKMFTFILLIITFSCSDSDKDILDDFTSFGAFPKFAEEIPPATVGVTDINDLVYSFEIIDANNAISLYDLDLYAIIGGVRTETFDVDEFTSFPVNLTLTADNLANILEIEVSDIGFGDNFFFTATATSKDGLVYGGSERLDFDDLGDDDPSNFILEGQGVSDDLLDEDGYRQAYEFDFIILCPSVDFSTFPGVYNVAFHRFDAFFGPQGDTREIIAGPGVNQITILGGAVPLDGADDLILEIDPQTGNVSYGGENGKIHFNTFGPGNYAAVTGLVFTCIGKIDIQIDSDGFIPNFLVLEKQ